MGRLAGGVGTFEASNWTVRSRDSPIEDASTSKKNIQQMRSLPTGDQLNDPSDTSAICSLSLDDFTLSHVSRPFVHGADTSNFVGPRNHVTICQTLLDVGRVPLQLPPFVPLASNAFARPCLC